MAFCSSLGLPDLIKGLLIPLKLAIFMRKIEKEIQHLCFDFLYLFLMVSL